tara:strand:- start:5791 stop:6126 length:336 start_codon:yes stop_codon:yes gene_type:complete
MPGQEQYIDKEPNLAVIRALRKYRQDGFRIAIYTSRNMRSHDNSLGKIVAQTVPLAIEWLNRHEVPFDEFWPAKPWCGPNGFYVDDRAIRPSEFVTLDREQIDELLSAEHS